MITNPPVALREPFDFNRENPEDYSLVELKTLKALGRDRFDFKITTERRRIVPRREIEANRMREEEKKRLEALRESEVARASGLEAVSKTIAVA